MSTKKMNLPENEEIPMAEIYHLSDKALFFDMVLTKSYVDSARQLYLPAAALSVIPSTAVPAPVVLSHGGKSWTVHYSGGPSTRPKFTAKWNNFVEDNRLKSGDACVFELIDPSPTTKLPVLKVHILRGDLPPELQAKEDAARGKTADVPVTID